MKRTQRALLPLALAAGITAMIPLAGANADSGSTTYTATLNPLNHATGSGMLTLKLSGDTATVNEQWSGLAGTFSGAPYPHVQHIHEGAQGVCPPASADKNGDGVVDVTEGAPFYGAIGASLTTSGDTSAAAGTDLKTAPAGASTTYSRTFTLNSATVASIKAGTAVIVVHGLDPTTLSKKAQGEKSDIVPSLPMAATAPALCGTLTAMPMAPQTGYGSTAGTEDKGAFGLAGGLFALGGAGIVLARRRTRATAKS
jgi:hypothetical protein